MVVLCGGFCILSAIGTWSSRHQRLFGVAKEKPPAPTLDEVSTAQGKRMGEMDEKIERLNQEVFLLLLVDFVCVSLSSQLPIVISFGTSVCTCIPLMTHGEHPIVIITADQVQRPVEKGEAGTSPQANRATGHASAQAEAHV